VAPPHAPAVVTGPRAGVPGVTRLRVARPDEDALLAAWRGEPASPYEDWSGPPPPGVGGWTAVPPPEGGGELVVTDGRDRPLGTVSWRPVAHGPAPGAQALDVGISLRPPAWGQGHGGRAQRLLADYLFATTAVQRVQASTDVENLAEQGALRRAGFTLEGVLRDAQWRAGAYRTLQSWSRLRTDA
jgi:RimJ/RimL family protein N-acetyltransferase